MNKYQRRNYKNYTNHERIQSFYEHKAIFIHIPKTAGSTVGKGLFTEKILGHTDLKDFQLFFSKKDLREDRGLS